MSVTDDPELMRLLTKVYQEKKLDFTQYKENSLLRRIHSRLSKHNVTSYDAYIKILEANPKEYKALVDAITINVTEFFRNPESFQAIKETAIPQMLDSKRDRKHKI